MLSKNMKEGLRKLDRLLNASKLKMATAESCTGGLVSSALTSRPGVSPYLERGFVVYSPDAKCELLGLSRAQIDGCDGVSAEVAREMARGALARSHADIAIAVTGFAGPQEGSEEVGLVYLALVHRDGEAELRTCHFGDIGRISVCRKAAEEALDMLLSAMNPTTTSRSVERGNVGNSGV